MKLAELPNELRRLADEIDGAHQAGYIEQLEQARQRGVDMETALAYLLLPRVKNRMATIRPYLEKWRGKTALNWDWYWNTGGKGYE